MFSAALKNNGYTKDVDAWQSLMTNPGGQVIENLQKRVDSGFGVGWVTTLFLECGLHMDCRRWGNNAIIKLLSSPHDG